MGNTSKILKNSYKSILKSNGVISSLDDFFLSGYRSTVNHYKNGAEGVKGSIANSIIAGHKGATSMDTAKLVAGSYITASSAARLATGGGVTRDRNGNANIIGVPFV